MVKLIVYIVAGLLVLSFFGISLQNLIDSPTTQENFRYFGDLLEQGWNQLIDLLRGIFSPLGINF